MCMWHVGANNAKPYVVGVVLHFYILCNFFCSTKQSVIYIIRQVLEPLVVSFGYKEGVARSFGINIQKGDDFIVLVYFFGWYLSGRYFAKNTVFHMFSFAKILSKSLYPHFL